MPKAPTDSSPPPALRLLPPGAIRCRAGITPSAIRRISRRTISLPYGDSSPGEVSQQSTSITHPNVAQIGFLDKGGFTAFVEGAFAQERLEIPAGGFEMSRTIGGDGKPLAKLVQPS